MIKWKLWNFKTYTRNNSTVSGSKTKKRRKGRERERKKYSEKKKKDWEQTLKSDKWEWKRNV